MHVPFNFHTVPTVSLRQACFSTNQYEHNAFRKCFSNLLGVGFRRFTIDVYWDHTRTDWSLCPVEIPNVDNKDQPVPVATGPRVVVSTDTSVARVPESSKQPLKPSPALERRQDAPTTPSSSAGPPSSRTVPANPTVVSFPLSDGSPMLQIGSYNCTTSTTLGLLTGILNDFLDSTATTIGAAISLLTLNVHVASSSLDPDGPAPTLSQNQMPASGSLLSDLLKGNLSQHTYTPTQLRDERGNLNRSWYSSDRSTRPLSGYYNLSANPNSHSYTTDGWPTEWHIEFQELRRVVMSFGTLDPQMNNYMLESDLDFIFPPGSLSRNIETSVDTKGQLTSGCLFDASENTVTPRTNSSWAIAVPPSLNISADPNLLVPVREVTNLTSCGLTAYLNQSLANTTADKNPLPYAAYVHSTLWSWSPGEPLNASSDASNTTGNRCVVMGTSPYPGRWRVTDCTERHKVACHDASQPYNWNLSPADADYASAASACRSPFTFSAPHTALENAHLLAALQAHRQAVPADDAVYIDLNALSVPDCWVIGLNGTCPYLPSTDTDHTKIVIVPTVAAVIIFVLAVLTFFVKCAANRREDKRGRRRRMVGGWEYEGVPS